MSILDAHVSMAQNGTKYYYLKNVNSYNYLTIISRPRTEPNVPVL